MSKTLTDLDLARIATHVYTDRRPAELRSLRDAEHPTCLYYRFLYELAAHLAPVDVLEIGTYCGVSAAHLAHENPKGSVITIDINPDAKRQVDALGYGNIEAITGDSAAVLTELAGAGARFDLAYIDGHHDFNQAYGEYVLARPLVRDGGLIVFDDVGLEMDGDEMEVFWSHVVDPKARVDWLHPNVGFGFCTKEPSVVVPPWAAVADKAREEIAARRTMPRTPTAG